MSFQQYVPLLLSAAEAYDVSFKIAKCNTRRQTYHTDMLYSYDSDDDADPPFNVNTYIANVNTPRPPIQSQKSIVHSTNQHNFIPKEDWLRIP
jgi:hypothetical protein